MLLKSWRLVILLFGLSCLATHGQDDGGGVITVGTGSTGGSEGTVTVTSGSGLGTISGNFGSPSFGENDVLSFLAILPSQISFLSSWTIPQGSNLIFDLDLLGGGAANVHSFTAQVANEPYLTLDTITPEVPAGFADSFNTSTEIFTGENVSGADISSSEITGNGVTEYSQTPLATFTFTVDQNAPIGTILTLPTFSQASLFDSSGNAINTLTEGTIGPTVVAAGEPPAIWLLLIGGFIPIRYSVKKTSKLLAER